MRLLGPLGLLRPWWHTALGFLAGVAWALLLITPAYLLNPRSAERKAVADVYDALAQALRSTGTPEMAAGRVTLTTALNAAYDAVLTGRASASGRTARDRHLMAVLNVSHQFAEAAAALRATGERVPPLVTDTGPAQPAAQSRVPPDTVSVPVPDSTRFWPLTPLTAPLAPKIPAAASVAAS